jgi:hypothetical protein
MADAVPGEEEDFEVAHAPLLDRRRRGAPRRRDAVGDAVTLVEHSVDTGSANDADDVPHSRQTLAPGSLVRTPAR